MDAMDAMDALASEVKASSEHHIIPKLYTKWMQYSGLFLPSLASINSGKLDRKNSHRAHFTWSCVILLLLLLLFAIDQYDFFVKFGQLLQDMEYFTCVAYDFRSLIKGQGPFTIGVMFLMRKKVSKLLQRCQQFLPTVLHEYDWQYLRRAFIVLCICTTVSIILCLSGIIFTTIALQETGYLERNQNVPYFFDQLKLPALLIAIFNGLGIYFGVSCEYLTLTLLVIIALHIFVAFKRVSLNFDAVVQNAGNISQILGEFRNYLILVNLVDYLNKTFSPILLISCVKDLISYAAQVGTYLQMYTTSVELSAEHTERSVAYMRGMDAFTFFFAQVSFVNMIIRIAVFCKMHTAAQSFRHRLRMIHLSEVNDDLKREITVFGQNTTISDGAVTVYGMLELSKEYVVTTFGLAMTYYIFVYQARDSQRSVEDLKSSQKSCQAAVHRILNGSLATV
ncbi:uncharacterized protein LOC129593072 [Paramacrobiotus metropolitanus]|uniref:uncharacterized protein LOC129593072 n=1 Tax=Paramacrobiotus metropolitanus TaxID=2943436 RepID=UPI00244623DA|nr:uncharacterized protein LOC129593072 [Paramacrobiotus metropolitanus]